MRPAVSQVCSLQSPFETDLADYAAGACPAIEIWLGKLESWLETHSSAACKALFAEHKIVPCAASFQGGLWTGQAAARQEHWQQFEQRLALCGELEIPTLVVAWDVRGPLTQPDLDRAIASLAQADEAAGRHGVRLALEFQAQATFGNNLQTAAMLVADCGGRHLGLCLDAIHFQLGPSKTEDLAYLTADNLFHVQFADLAGVPRELASDSDRILPGDGDLPLGAIVERLKTINYAGFVSVELMNPQIWAVPARQFGEVAMTALRKILGQASMGGQ